MTEIRDILTGRTLEGALKKREEEIKQIQKDYPDLPRPADDKWWVPSTTLSDDENRKLNEIIDKAIDSNFDPDVTITALEEIKTVLAVHDGLAEQFEAIFYPMDEGKAKAFRSVIEPMKRAWTVKQ